MKILKVTLQVLIVTLFSSCTINYLSAQTTIEVTGEITADTTWTADTVKVIGDITVVDDITLTIDSGTYVEFQGHYSIILQGTIYAVGTAEDSIIFTAKNTTEGWHGIRINNGPYDGLNGAMNDNQTSEFRFCRFSYGKPTGPNWNDNQGGVFYIFMFSKLIISDCMFTSNSAPNGGGAMHCAGSSPLITRCTFYNNHADESRGAALNFLNSVGVVCTHNLFIDNYGEVGGAICNFYTEMLIEHNIFLNNYAIYYGGCLYSQGGYDMIISNNLMANNFAAEGGALYLTSTNPVIINNTIVNNFAGDGGGIYLGLNSNPVFYNSIVWGNERPVSNPSQFYIADDLSDPNFYGCIIEGGTAAFQLAGSCQYTGQYENLMDADPLFVAPSTSSGAGGGSLTDNWQLSAASPCINAFKNYVPSRIPEHDLGGNQRIIYGTIDPGAYEFRQDEMTASGTIASNLIWAADTVRVMSNVTLNSGYQLRILPGVVVAFQGAFQLDIKGQLIAAGTENEMIVFTSADTSGFFNQTHLGWKGIRFWEVPLTNDTSYLSYVIIEYGKSNAGMTIYRSPKLVLSDCIFRNNIGNSTGGALEISGSPILIENCLIQNNYANTGGGIFFDFANAIIRNCTISGNSAMFYTGGGIDLNRGSNIEMVNCHISNNYSQEQGGGLNSSVSSPLIINSLITNNTSELEGGGMYFDSSVPEVYNTDITNNHSFNFGGGLCFFNSNATLCNSIISGNQADTAGDQVFLLIDAFTDFYNCDIEGDSSSFGKDQYAKYNGEYSGNINIDPQFNQPSAGAGIQYDGINTDWGISDFSACINAGIIYPPDVHTETRDFAGNPRINHDTIDMGALENQSGIPQILNKLENQVRCLGDSVAFSVEVSDTAKYQWFKNGVAIPGETGTTLILNSIQSPDQGNYLCRANNAYGRSETNIAFLTVNLPPEILVEPEDTWIETGKTWKWTALINGSPPFSYQWKKDGEYLPGAITPELVLIQPDSSNEGLYTLQVANACKEISTDEFNVFVVPQICMVTVDPLTGNNLVIWEKKSKAPLLAYNIYRESEAAGIYDLMGNVSHEDLSIFVDSTADPTVQAYLYKITGIDTSGYETDIDLCKPHKTIHLLVSTNPELNTTQLEWDKYYGFEYQTYHILRSATGTNFTEVHSIASTLTSWTDPDPIPGIGYYRITVEKPDPCYPTGGSKKAESGPYSHSMSNIEDNRLQEVQENQAPTDINLTNNTITENQSIGSLVGRLETTDADTADHHTYKLVSGSGDEDNNSFTTLGDLLITAEILDYETKDTLYIRVKSTDKGDLSVEESFIILVTDVNEGTGNLAPTDITLSFNSIDENKPVGTLIGKFQTIDPNEEDMHTYGLVEGLGGDDNNSFTIIGDMLISSGIFDYETKSEYSVRVRSRDDGDGRLSFQKSFIIYVNDLLETEIIDYHLKHGGVEIYPNPFTDKAIIQFQNPTGEKYNLYITDLTGKVIFLQDNIFTDKIEFSRNGISDGCYFLELRGPETYRSKIIIE
jgi:hypothetical protein